MIEALLRSKYQQHFVKPIARWLSFHLKIKPANITSLALLSGVLSPVMLYRHHAIFACFLLLVSGYLDSLDGTLARLQSIQTNHGAMLDIMVDRIVEFGVIFGLFIIAPQERAVTSIWMLGSTLLCITSFLVVAIFTHNRSHKSFHYSVGLMERAEAFLFFMAMMLLPQWFNSLAWTYIGLVLLTAAHRFISFYRVQCREGEQ